ncbi:uncharacterized protein LOC131651340 [Vicia villosa]|uniref:uncharacterized protein LOC131651340 n=1 Tax=Vicia villosa TaxID=3911 RepID=UPI00273B9EE6|nr:uncharacterized protein LOC131651340 [Vicia villosa]
MAAIGPCANSPRLNPQFVKTAANGRTSELKTGIKQLVCASPFAGLDHEDPYTHLTRFYELAENPKEHCKAVVTRPGQKGSNNEVEKNNVEDDTEEKTEKHDGEDEEYEIIDTNAEEEHVNKEVKKKEKLKRKSSKEKMASNVIPSQHLPYPHAPSKKDNARQYTSAIIQRTTPRKESDPGQVTLPLNIGRNLNGDGLIDLGSSINLILLAIVKKLGNVVMKPTSMTLQLADKSITTPYGVVQDLLVKIDKFFFPVDFVVVDMEEDHEMQQAKRGRTKSTSTGPRGAPIARRFLGPA